ncbi:MAG TPA: class I SAM-dependent methyltransferase [Chloroflexota bacterium]|nr:class I SAM-dependent methyltransferase [Chloroflexota bacterium]
MPDPIGSQGPAPAPPPLAGGRTAGAHFDRIAALYNASLPPHVVRHYLEKRVRFIRDRLPPPARVLDVGCGTGLLAQRLAREGYTMTGLDPSHGMLRYGERVARYVQGDGAALPFGDRTFDGAITVAALHHIFEPRKVAATIREMLRVTRPGGVVVIWDHNPLNPYWPLLMRRLPQDEEDTRLVPAGEILRAVRAAGADTVEVVRSGWVPDFAPRWALPAFQQLERVLEQIPLVKELAAHNVVVVWR